MHTVLQVWGGAAYLIHKICLSRAERSAGNAANRRWRLRSWAVYLAGLPAWVAVFLAERNWIAASVEAGGGPAMVIGLIIALRGHGAAPRWLDLLARFSVAAGLGVSLLDFGGITTVNQVLELVIAAGFLMGTYLLANDRMQGYFWFMLGNVGCSILMGIQGYHILMLQQGVSLAFVIDAYRMRRRNRAGQRE